MDIRAGLSVCRADRANTADAHNRPRSKKGLDFNQPVVKNPAHCAHALCLLTVAGAASIPLYSPFGYQECQE